MKLFKPKMINTAQYEDVSDFASEALICKKCNHEMQISGPLPHNAKCHVCGSTNLIRRNNPNRSKNDQRAA